MRGNGLGCELKMEPSTLVESTGSTWVERLLLTLLTYSVIIAPIAFVVIATRRRLFPKTILSSTIIQWFVYGQNSSASDDQEQLIHQDVKIVQDDNSKFNQLHQIKSSSTLDFMWCLVGLQLSYLAWGILQEKIMTTQYVVYSASTSLNQTLNSTHSTTAQESTIAQELITFHDSQFLVFMNRMIAFILSAIALVYNRPKESQFYLNSRRIVRSEACGPQAPLYEYVYCSLSNILSSWCQYEALKYVNFPTQVLSKSCKIIPVMLMSKLIHKKKYQTGEYLSAASLSIGLFIFLLNPIGSSSGSGHHARNSDQKLGESTLASGLIILALYLMFDSFTSNWQQSLFERYRVNNWQMMAATNFYSILLTLISLYQLDALRPALKLLSRSSQLLSDCIIMSAMSSIGQLFVFYTIKRFGSVLFAVIMTLRQFLAILLSCTIYGHRLSLGSSLGLLIVFMVVGYQVWSRSQSGRAKKQLGPKLASEWANKQAQQH